MRYVPQPSKEDQEAISLWFRFPDSAGPCDVLRRHLGVDLCRHEAGDTAGASDVSTHGMVWYDLEMINVADDYTLLLTKHAAATGGEWQPEQARSFYVGNDADTTQVEFVHQGTQFCWLLENTATDWVSMDFITEVGEFVARHLTGEFISISTGGQDMLSVYVPGPRLAEYASGVRTMSDL